LAQSSLSLRERAGVRGVFKFIAKKYPLILSPSTLLRADFSRREKESD